MTKTNRTLSSPGGVGPRHLANEITDLPRRRSPTALVSAVPGPIQPEAFPVPSNDGLGLHQDQGLGPIVPCPGQEHPEESITLLQAGALDGALEDDNLLPQREILMMGTSLVAEGRRCPRIPTFRRGANRGMFPAGGGS